MERGMSIAVSGWYFKPELFEVFKKIKEQFDITVLTYVERAEDNCPRDYDIIPASEQIKRWVIPSEVTHIKIPVGGLEFGGYDWYIKNVWDRKSPVLFMHDDIKIYDINVFADIESRLKEIDQCYMFRDEIEVVANGTHHGRGIYCSARFIRFMLDYVCNCAHAKDHEHPHYPNEKPKVMLNGVGPHTGFFYDPYFYGEHLGIVPKHCRHYNEAIYHFDAFAGRCHRTDPPWPGYDTKVKIYFPKFNSGKRGFWQGKVYDRGESLE